MYFTITRGWGGATTDIQYISAETCQWFFEPGTDGIAPIGNRCHDLMELEDWNENNLGVPITMFPP